MQKLIKSDKLRELVKLWTEYNEIKPEWVIRVRRGDWDHGGFCSFDSVMEFYEYNSRMSLFVYLQDKERKLKSDKDYSLESLLCKS